jgi:hypothetical protein
MASKSLGRAECPIRCGFSAAHVKVKTDKAEGKTAYPYIHCPSCGCQLHTKNSEQAEYLLKITRPEKIVETVQQEALQDEKTDKPIPTQQGTEKTAQTGYRSRFGRSE